MIPDGVHGLRALDVDRGLGGLLANEAEQLLHQAGLCVRAVPAGPGIESHDHAPRLLELCDSGALGLVEFVRPGKDQDLCTRLGTLG